MKIHIDSGKDIPLIELVDFIYTRGASKITRVDQQRIVNVTADVDKEKINMTAVVADLKPWLDTLMQDYPRLYITLEGEQQEQKESLLHLGLGVVFVLFVIYALLAIPFASYLQPFIVMSIIPFSIIGAIFGHVIMGMSLSISSLMGVLALIGVVVNDSLVLVDYVNKQVKSGTALYDAVCRAGQARFRPILLTSLTTFAGLLPLYFEKSSQAQFLIPMAISLGFGILFATFITLLLIPVNYMILEDFRALFRRLFKRKKDGNVIP